MDIEGKTIQEGEPIPDYPCEIKNEINIAGAIEILNILKSKVTLVKVDDENNSEKEYRLPYLISIEKQAIETVLSELEKKDKEYEELTEASKELCKTVNLMKKVINEMAEYIIDLIKYNNSEEERDKEEIKQYLKEYQHKYYMEVTKIKREKLQAVKQLNKKIREE